MSALSEKKRMSMHKLPWTNQKKCRAEVRDRIVAGSAMVIKELQRAPAGAPASPAGPKLSKPKEKEFRREQAWSIIFDELRQRHSGPSGSVWQTSAIRCDRRITALDLSKGELDYVLALGLRQGLWARERHGRESFWKLPQQGAKPTEQQALAGKAGPPPSATHAQRSLYGRDQARCRHAHGEIRGAWSAQEAEDDPVRCGAKDS